ncbi:AAA family ATPase [Tenacibaculum finnmarkense]|uniref:AAA family ATPase n=1 Tax=Tenacibaculum finnmarkense TaxID=2781243 RepID=UPI001EFBFA4E|nr:AAA family ATPase [Tenacibaculum finnmarkense]MCG8784209.1 AAA family ATPase [Tenacibaculum finnmarkense]
MSKTLSEIAELLKGSSKKVQLIYAFNGTGKTRLSRKFRLLIDPKVSNEEQEENQEALGIKVMYYNAFTEDLFYWDNDLDADTDRKLIIRPNNFTNLALGFLKDQGLGNNIVTNFQKYTNNSITPIFSDDFSEVSFAYTTGDDSSSTNIKVSKGEESNFIWCVFYSLLEQIVELLNVPEPQDRASNQFDDLEYIFIDDPVSSLDDTHLIELAVNIAELIKSSQSEIKFIITTHNPLFYNVLYNEFNNTSNSGYRRKHSEKKRLEKLIDGTFLLSNQPDDSPFSYHLFLLKELYEVLESGQIKKYHFNFLRNILEKTSTFLGYNKWKDLLPEDTEGAREAYYNRIINLSSHSNHHGEEVSVITENDKNVLRFLVNQIKTNYRFNSINS